MFTKSVVMSARVHALSHNYRAKILHRLTHLQRRDFAMHRAQLINTNISRISPESTPIQEGIDKEAGGAAEACQASAAGSPRTEVHEAELGPAGTQ